MPAPATRSTGLKLFVCAILLVSAYDAFATTGAERLTHALIVLAALLCLMRSKAANVAFYVLSGLYLAKFIAFT